jgi:hypothetical protein
MPTPAVEQYPTRSEPATRGRRANVTPGRWATIERVEVGDDSTSDYAREVVINISMTIPPDRPPELPGLSGAGESITDKYFLERVGLGVKIGMIRGGPVDASGGFGFPDLEDRTGSLDFTQPDNGGYVALIEDI